MRDFMVARYPEMQLTFINQGVSGNTTRDLLARWERDVLDMAPDWLSVKIGINDVWRGFDGKPEEAVTLPEYASNLRKLLDLAQAKTDALLILLTPYMIEADRTQPSCEMFIFG